MRREIEKHQILYYIVTVIIRSISMLKRRRYMYRKNPNQKRLRENVTEKEREHAVGIC